MTDIPRLVRTSGKPNWQIYYNRQRISTGTEDRTAAEQALAEFRVKLTHAPDGQHRIAPLLEAYLANRVKRGVVGAERLRYAHARLIQHIGEMAISNISGDTCIDYTARRKQAGVADRTIRTELEALRAALHFGATKEGGNVVVSMPSLELPSKGHGRERWLTRAEATSLMAACRYRHLKLFVALALNTAARHKTILSLTWDRVDLVNRTLDYRTGMVTNKRKVRVPINQSLHSLLSDAKRLATCDYVIERDGKRVASVRHGFMSACAAADLHNVTPHTLRHTAATWMLQAKVPLWEVAGFSGMTEGVLKTIYAHHDTDFLRSAADALDSVT